MSRSICPIKLLCSSALVWKPVCLCDCVHMCVCAYTLSKLAFVRQTERICFVNVMCHAAAHRPRHYGMEKINKEERSWVLSTLIQFVLLLSRLVFRPFPVCVVSKMTCAATFRPAWAVKNSKYSHDLIPKTSWYWFKPQVYCHTKDREREREKGLRGREVVQL